MGNVVLAYDSRLKVAASEHATQEKRSSTLLDEPVQCCGQWFYTFEGIKMHNELKHKKILAGAEEVAGVMNQAAGQPRR